MDYETLLTVQGYTKFFLVLVVFILFYSYAFSIYRRDKRGERDFEKYSKLVHDDSSVSAPLEEIKREKDIGNKEK
ncbi:CcoQ/FixQ family Cbb3-type cytochrome c oxidase assembly chaperone [Aliarcobacter lanthieri]|uniref:CcoQ/FixQ family Cbb3-type cytochrome c oxidase assembly chaperone n=1 Tax=Arcobacteraceae TaxID=2808963 RepID=UPI00047BBC45|nr:MULTISPECIES: CcoQ/FixQ family Cbb3-type cytochrome c oxidase assembly chaperone [Arcobacteraceae]MBL3519791.1 CcoQ/FixQ family Cbb3-type cytochrome c oxidase assembly chaperone [Aliarcobacter lanthieri]QKF60086.1 cytochrome c oxidase CcoNOPQ, cbb3-type, subunit IV [Aliarcobacter lanthieri]RBQ26494.1 CcoQ/FixQ family Cbb3-type cytochrome c oxidase assembly chaperone [Arcobacter sp. CECT 9188]